MAISPKPYDYQAKLGNTRNNVEYQRFKEEYYSGQDARIYFGKIWVDEIVDLRFQLIENAAPIFGYASYTWDAIAKGNRQVSGTFRINFKESYYLHSIINELEYELSGSTKAGPISNTVVPTNGITADHLLKTIENVYSASEFDKLATQFEKSLWGQSSNSAMQNKTDTRGQGSYFTPESTRPKTNEEGFSIVLFYGPYTQTYSANATKETVATTAKTITGVHITGVSQVIDGSGQPIYEDYTFIARDLDSNANVMSSGPKYSFGKVVK